MELLEHPPYSPTEAPTDYHVNRSMKNWQAGKFFDDFYELVADIKKWIVSKNRNFFARGIDLLPSKCEAVLEVDDGKIKKRVRELILYEYRLGHTAHEAHVNICRAEGPNAVSPCIIGNENLQDLHRSGRPLEVDHVLVGTSIKTYVAT